jgi:hypothetical protein
MNKKTNSIDNFIGIYDNYITKEECNNAIKVFEDGTKYNRVLDRMTSEDASVLEKKDRQYFANEQNIDIWWQELRTLIINFDMALKHYIKNTGVGDAYDNNGDFEYATLKIQKTLPTEGYHVWHIEHGKGFLNGKRALAFSIYLNDVEEGGETEFLHFSKRVKPKTGRIVIWPSAFPYVHRGNSPLSGEKYLLTSWLMLKQ